MALYGYVIYTPFLLKESFFHARRVHEEINNRRSNHSCTIDGFGRLKPDVNNEFKTREGWGIGMNNFSQMYA